MAVARMIDACQLRSEGCECGCKRLTAFLVSPDGERARPLGIPGIIDVTEADWEVIKAASSQEAKDYVKNKTFTVEGHDVIPVPGNYRRKGNHKPKAAPPEPKEPMKAQGIPGNLMACISCPQRSTVVSMQAPCVLASHNNIGEWTGQAPEIICVDQKYVCAVNV